MAFLTPEDVNQILLSILLTFGSIMIILAVVLELIYRIGRYCRKKEMVKER